MLKKLLFNQDGGVALAPAPAAPSKPTATPAPAAKPSNQPATKPATATPAAPAPTEVESDDPFQQPKKDAPAAKPAENNAAPTKPDIEKASPKELRDWAKRVEAENRTLGEKAKSLEQRIADGDARGQDTSALTARLTAVEKERDAFQAELRAAKQEASPEFKEKYEKPFNAAAERTRKQITELTVTDAEGNGRPATWEDFAALYSLPTGKAIEQANALFGTAAHFVLQKREQLLDLQQSRDTALQEEKSKYKENNDRDIAEQARRRESFGKDWMDTNKRLSATDVYKVDPTDSELSEAAKHAESVFDAEVKGADRDDWAKKKILKDAHIKQKTIGYAVRGVQITRLKSEVETLKKQIDDLKGTAAGGTQRSSGDSAEKPSDDSPEAWEREAKNAMAAA